MGQKPVTTGLITGRTRCFNFPRVRKKGTRRIWWGGTIAAQFSLERIHGALRGGMMGFTSWHRKSLLIHAAEIFGSLLAVGKRYTPDEIAIFFRPRCDRAGSGD